jgi:hypothetical protein
MDHHDQTAEGVQDLAGCEVAVTLPPDREAIVEQKAAGGGDLGLVEHGMAVWHNRVARGVQRDQGRPEVVVS